MDRSAPHLLLVAGDDHIRWYVSEILEARGFKIQIAEDAERALSLARQEPPHLILIDFTMPKLDGLALLRKFREIPETCKTWNIILTGISNGRDWKNLEWEPHVKILSKAAPVRNIAKALEELVKDQPLPSESPEPPLNSAQVLVANFSEDISMDIPKARLAPGQLKKESCVYWFEAKNKRVHLTHYSCSYIIGEKEFLMGLKIPLIHFCLEVGQPSAPLKLDLELPHTIAQETKKLGGSSLRIRHRFSGFDDEGRPLELEREVSIEIQENVIEQKGLALLDARCEIWDPLSPTAD